MAIKGMFILLLCWAILASLASSFVNLRCALSRISSRLLAKPNSVYGADSNISESSRFSLFEQSLRAFKDSRGHCRVPSSYVADDGFKLGQAVRRVKYNKDFHDKLPQLKELGLDITKQTKGQRFENLFRALKIYHAKNAHYKIKANWKVPSEDPWPINLWGKDLNQLVRQLRFLDDISDEEKERLENIKFVWDPHKENGEKVLECVTIYHNLYGHTNVPAKYVVPHDIFKFPKYLRGMKLGAKLSNYRYNNQFSAFTAEFDKLGVLKDKAGADCR